MTKPWMIVRRFTNLVVEQKKLQHSPQALQLLALQPRKRVSSERKFSPLLQRLRFSQAQFSELRPDRNTGVGCKYIGRKTHIPKLPGDVAHGSYCFNTVRFNFARIPKNQIKRDVNPSQGRFSCGLIHFVHTLMTFVHDLQHIFGGGFGAKSHMGDATLTQHLNIVVTHAAEKVSGGLEGPAKTQLGFEKASGNLKRSP